MVTGFSGLATASVRGATLAYREHGDGEPVVFVHGDLSDLRTWEPQLDQIGASHRAIAYSRRYARPNDDIEPGADNPMMPHVEDLAEFLRAVDAAPANLVGSSWGAFICLLTAIHHPDVVRKLVLAEPPAVTLFVSAHPRPSELARLFARRPRTAVTLVRFAATVLGPAEKAFRRNEDEKAMLAFVGGVLGRQRFEGLPSERQEQARANRTTLKASLLGSGLPSLGEDAVRGIQHETLLMTGAESPPIFLRVTDRLEELLPHSERVEVPGASHVMNEENPGFVNGAILDFLS